MEEINEEILQPNIHKRNNCNDCYVLFFNDREFDHIIVENIICTLEDVKSSGSYNRVKIYLSSLGGKASQLFILSEYLNEYPLELIFVICNKIYSCGALLPLMVNKCKINYLPSASAMIHYVRLDIDSNVLYNYKPNTCESSSDLEKVKYLNNFLYDNYYSKLGLTKYELDVIKSGGDVYLNRERLEELFSLFKKRQYFEYVFEKEIYLIDDEINSLKNKIKNLIKKREKYFEEYNNFFNKNIDKY